MIMLLHWQDVSRVVDLCRHSIVFESAAGILECLNAMSRDPNVVIARIKNRLDPKFDSGVSAGYRNVSVNLRVVTDETKDLGVETHVCEVQLLLLGMAKIKVSIILKSF